MLLRIGSSAIKGTIEYPWVILGSIVLFLGFLAFKYWLGKLDDDE